MNGVELVAHDPAWSARAENEAARLREALGSLDAARAKIESLGYEWRGEFGIARRRFCPRDDPSDGRRLVHAHFFADGDPEIERHVAFRDYLRANPDLAREYEALKIRLAAEHTNRLEYADAKTPWIRSVESAAINFYRLK